MDVRNAGTPSVRTGWIAMVSGAAIAGMSSFVTVIFDHFPPREMQRMCRRASVLPLGEPWSRVRLRHCSSLAMSSGQVQPI